MQNEAAPQFVQQQN